jgi:hypothetical protein
MRMTTPPTTRVAEIPILPGHYRRAMWYFVRCWLGMVAGIGVFGLGLHWQSVVVQVFGGVLAFAAFLWMFSTIGRAQSARCPSCSATMTQGWDTKRQSSDGVLTCPQCHSRWRTSATWGFE